jgi:hypothetical protein
MKADFQRQGPWLLGSVGTPAIPPSWIAGARWHSKLASKKETASEKTYSSIQLATEVIVSAKNVHQINWVTSAELFSTQIRIQDSEWSIYTVSDPSLYDGYCLGDLPLLTTTFLSLQSLNFGRDAPLNFVAQVRRESLLRTENGALALLDLCVTLECWWPDRSLSKIHESQHRSSHLEQVAEALIREYLQLDGGRLDDEWVYLMLRRYSWGFPIATLDTIGQEIGLTRERVRQIQSRLEGFIGLRKWPLPDLLISALEVVSDGGFRKIQTALVESGLVADDDWTPEEFVKLLEWFGYRDESVILSGRFAEAEAKFSDPEAARAVRNARHKMGIIRLDSVARIDGSLIEPKMVKEVAEQLYSRVYESHGWLMVGSAQTNMIESGVGFQFFVTPELTAEELIDGLIRIQKSRSWPALPQRDVLLSLMLASGALLASGHKYQGPIVEFERDSLNGWLVSLFNEARTTVLHRETINRAAILDRYNIASLTHYTLYSPVVRNLGDNLGLIRLVGRFPTEDEQLQARQVAEVLRVPNDLIWSTDSRGIGLTLTFGSNFIATGVISVPLSLARMWPVGGTSIRCLCVHPFGGHIRISSSNLMSGWTTLIQHLLLEHGLKEGSKIDVQINGKELQILRWEI